MEKVQRRSALRTVDVPIASGAPVSKVLPPDLQAAAVRLITRAEAMGLVASDDLLTSSTSVLAAAMRAFHEVGIGRRIGTADLDHATLVRMNSIVEDSPHPDTEWGSILQVLPADTLTTLLGISESSLRRYSSQDRPTPPAVAARLHWLAMRIADLAGAYNSYGIQRWFDRNRRDLAGQSPAARLTDGWSPDDEQVVEIADLAARLTAMSAT